MGKSSFAKTLNTWVFYISLATLIYSFWHRNDFPADLYILDSVKQYPIQTATNKAPFKLTYNDIEYEIIPQYQYELSGLVVSYEHHSGDQNLHERWSDHINVVDLCVVWQNNAMDIDLNLFEFWNGQFTCNYGPRSGVTPKEWQTFQHDQLSNNHILTDTPEIRERIKDVKIGDQIYFKGWLAKYKNNLGFNRGTSTTRDDTGNGACETIYLEEFEILQTNESDWKRFLLVSALSCLITAFIWFVAVLKGKF